MKRLFLLLFTVFAAYACSGEKLMILSVKNTMPLDRSGEIVEVSMTDVLSRLKILKNTSVVVLDAAGKQHPYQVTFDGKLIFPVSVKAGSEAEFTIKAGTPDSVRALTYGRLIPERKDDICWENDRIAFRTYGPALEATGEVTNGYDVWVKRVPEPIIDMRYEGELGEATQKRIAELKKLGNTDSLKAFEKSISYHIDHGNGLDFYDVKRTLGAGAMAPYVGDSLWLANNFITCEVLESGPLRFTCKLTYAPFRVAGDMISETRIISLDAGSQLNKVVESYQNVKKTMPVATGIVIHKGSNYQLSPQKEYIIYADPSNPVNGQIYIATVFPESCKELKEDNGHALGIFDYKPESELTYYSGAGWSKWGFETLADWEEYVKRFVAGKKQPLQVILK